MGEFEGKTFWNVELGHNDLFRADRMTFRVSADSQKSAISEARNIFMAGLYELPFPVNSVNAEYLWVIGVGEMTKDMQNYAAKLGRLSTKLVFMSSDGIVFEPNEKTLLDLSAMEPKESADAELIDLNQMTIPYNGEVRVA